MNVLDSIKRFYASSIGKKLLVALTGIVLLLFVFGHLAGNLLIYLGRGALNDYAEFLADFLHGTGIWFARVGLLAAFVIHIVTTIHLARQNRAAREARYVREGTVQASKASLTMVITGTVILLFVIFHILHFTILPGPDDVGYYEVTADYLRHDVYGMTVRGFQNPFISIFYIVSMAFLCFHLSHGVASVFQTLGWRTEKTAPLIRYFGLGYACFIFLGNISIPLAVLLGFITL